ncbi:hypothetical protein KTD19_22650 [Burkholderia multivorans]|uniref:Uncharacterized protein n=2 Tax=Burkholderia cepacia complex TaxID=87882 RepID=A4JRY6_BURVG|nr:MULTISPECIES: hypothetical protein [Burkholderia cepacia complex]ABO59039.1 hypothetical protein Bcep1808_6121 [Burkholderia vietnamiensis G4]MBR8396637.1 hypothetical protein [Burkholderia cenocepacia]AOK02199.1 hypothetical protein WK23_26070 [Burkholderia vietnamiensis]AYY99596.1 hypothetical protein EGY19_19475 [Burkholderia multivorans]KVR75247.1 hypothetical protein WK26_26685 [Burkholderia vietnamiensis]
MGTNNSSNVQEIEIRLKRAPDDLPENDPAFQKELRSFSSALYSAGIRYSQRGMAFDSAAAMGYPLAEFIIKELGPAAIGVIGTAVGAWISGRHGRKMRLKIGDIEVEARTMNEVDQLLQRARALQVGQEGDHDEA